MIPKFASAGNRTFESDNYAELHRIFNNKKILNLQKEKPLHCQLAIGSKMIFVIIEISKIKTMML